MSSEIYLWSRNVHLVFGSLALVLFWLQLARRKGGSSHTRAGWGYAASMIGVLVSSIPMIAIAMNRGQLEVGFFLGFLFLITTVAGLEAIMASRNRDSGAWIRGPLFKSLTALIGAYSLLLFVMYFRIGLTVLLLMAAVGVLATIEGLIRMQLGRPYVWWVEHVNGILGTGIAIHVAFFSFGLRGLFGGESFSIWTFVVPIDASQLFAIYFKRTFAGGARKAETRAVERGVVV